MNHYHLLVIKDLSYHAYILTLLSGQEVYFEVENFADLV